MYFTHYGQLPPKPYVIDTLGHQDYFGTPNAHLVPGLVEAYAAAGIRRIDLRPEELHG
jgi:hypothetical protein